MMRPAERTLGRYTLLRRLASGGMGEVFLAEVQGAANFTKKVAIKRILPHLARNEDFVKKFIDEANVMVQLHHGNIVPVMELADQQGELFIVMEYLPGRDLKAVLHRLRRDERTFPPDLAVWIIAEVCAGLDYAHRKHGPDGQPLHIVHRDVSPSNVVLGAGGEVKLLDFGIARARGGLHQSISGTLQGKFVYMSPEQAEGRSVDPRSDIFSAGLVLYEMLCGVRPFEGESETETLRRVREGRVEPPSSHRPELPAELDAIVMQAVARDPDARHASAGDLRRALLHYLVSQGSAADASSLSRFLRELFPEGVVPPDTPDRPLSLDDALDLQLGALTPSLDALGNTRTASLPSETTPGRWRAPGEGAPGTPPGAGSAESARGPAHSPSGPVTPSSPGASGASHPATPSAGTGPLPPVGDSGSSPALGWGVGPSGPFPVTDPGPRRRTTRALLAALVASLGAAAWAWWPRTATITPVIRPASATGVRILIDREEYAPPIQVSAGTKTWMCVEADGYEPDCKWVTARRGTVAPEFDLQPLPTLDVRLQPEDVADPRVTVDGRPHDPAAVLERDRAYRVCAVAEGYDETCETYRARPGPGEVVLALRPLGPPDAGAAEPADAGPPDAGHPEPPRPRPAPPRDVRFEVEPREAKLYDGDRALSGHVVRAPGDRSIRIRVAAPGYRDRELVVRPDQRGPIRVRLERLPTGLLTIRGVPPATVLYLDGQELADNPVQRLRVPAGEHTIVGVWRNGDRTYRKEKKVRVPAGGAVTESVDCRPPSSDIAPAAGVSEEAP